MPRHRWLFPALRLPFSAEAGTGLLPGIIVAAGSAVVIVSLYLALEWLSYLHVYKGIPVTPWNPGLGLIFGLAVLRGPVHTLLLGVGIVLADIFILKVAIAPELVAAIAVVAAGGYALAAWILRQKLRLNRALPRLRDVVLLVLVAIIAALIVDLFTAGLLMTEETIEQNDFFATFLPLFIGDAIGIAVFAPIVLRLAARIGAAERLGDILPGPSLVAIAGCIVLVIVLLQLALGTQGMRYLFVLFIPAVFAGVREGIDGACFGLAAVQLGLVSVFHVTGQDLPTFIEVQSQMLVLTITGLIVGSIVTERQAIAAAAGAVAERLKELEAEAAQAARANIAEGMSSALAHEINQPITAVRALARSAQHLLGSEQPDLDRAKRNLAELIAQVDHAGQIVRRMREFLRRGRPHISTLVIDMVLRNAVTLIATDAGRNGVDIVIRHEPDLPPMFGDKTQIEQVLLNLMRNSLDALTEMRRSDGLIEIGAVLGQTSGTVEFFVRDNGPGIPAGQIDRLFDPLVSMKRHGLGLGLAICATIVQNHRGKLWLAGSRPGNTEFRFALPLDAGDV